MKCLQAGPLGKKGHWWFRLKTTRGYRLGKDGVLRRCVPKMERIALLEEAHEDEARGHITGEVMTKMLLQDGY